MTHSREEMEVKIREAADHPLALLFGALGIAYPTPSKAARAAKERAGLSNKEEKLAKWVAVLKRESQEVFGQDFWQALKTILQEEEKEMEVKWGANKLLQPIEKIAKRILGKCLDISVGTQSITGFSRTPVSPDTFPAIITIWRECGDSRFVPNLIQDGEYQNICIFVKKYHPRYLAVAKKFALEYERFTGKNATVVRDW